MSTEDTESKPPLNVLAIAGSDSGGGAGIQASLKTMSALGVYGATVITACTAQNTRGVQAVSNLPVGFVKAQLDSVMGDIAFGAVVTGMLSTREIVDVVSDHLAETISKDDHTFLVVDPVMVASSGDRLLQEDAIESYKTKLLPLADVVTPNFFEAEVLADMTINNDDDKTEAAKRILAFGCKAVVIKGGHAPPVEAKEAAESHAPAAKDILFERDGDKRTVFEGPRIETENNHGTGCTFAAALASYLARGQSLTESVASAKGFVFHSLAASDKLNVGGGKHGPVNHLWKLDGKS